MKNTGLIIKAAVIVFAIASLFSIVTLIRAIIIKSNIVLPIIQVVGSLAIFAVCFIMLRTLSAAAEEDEGEDNVENTDDEENTNNETEKADELYEKYRLSDFEKKKDEE